MLDIYFLEASKFWSDDSDIGQVELKDQYVCRAWFAKALLCSEGAKGLTGQALVTGVESALKCLLEGLRVALEDSRYIFLLYDASVHYWNISRPLQKSGSRRYLVEASTSINDALQKVSGHEEWKAHNLRIHALCLSDAGKNADALKVASDAVDLCKASVPELSTLAIKVKSHVSSLEGSKEGGDGEDGAVSLMQHVRSGACADAEDVKNTLIEAWKLVDPAAEKLEAAKDESVEDCQMDVVAEIGWVAAQNEVLDLAEWCSERVADASTILARVRVEMTRSMIALHNLGEKRGSLDPEAIGVHKDVILQAEKSLSTFSRLQDFDGIHDACQLIWAASLPLQQRQFRHHLTRVLGAAATALESVGSSANRLRTALHLELAYCYISEDMVGQAKAQVSKGLALDYVAPAEEIESTGYERPLDRFLDPLNRVLSLKSKIHDDPDDIEDQALLHAEQARDAKSVESKADLLQRAVEKLMSLQPAALASESEEMSAEARETRRRSARARINIWGSVIKVAMDAKQTSMVHRFAKNVIDTAGWDLIKDKDIILLQADVNLLDGLASFDILRSRGVPVIPPTEINTEFDSTGESTEELQNNSVAAFIRAMHLGASVGEDWVVMNAAAHVWNNYLAVFMSHRYAEMLPATAPVFAELCKVETCEKTLLGNFADALSCGYEHAAFVSVTNADDIKEGDVLPDYKALRLTLRDHKFEESRDMQRGIEACESVLNRVDERNSRKLSATLARLHASMGTSSEVKVEEDPVAQVSAIIQRLTLPGSDDTSSDMLNEAMSLLRPAEGEVLGDLETWARLGETALKAKAYGSAIECGKQAEIFLNKLTQTAPSQSWYWGGVAESAFGCGILALIRPDHQDQSTQDTLRQKAFQHLVQAAKCGRRANRSDIVSFAGKHFWNSATSYMSSATTRRNIFSHLQVIIDACRATKVKDDSLMKFMWILYFDCLVDKKAWTDGIKQIDEAFKMLPTSDHQRLWEYKVLFLSATGRKAEDELDMLSSYDQETQAKVWAGVAVQATSKLEGMKAYRKAIDVLDDSAAMKVDLMIDFADWMYGNGQPVADAEDLLVSTLDILLETDDDATGDKMECESVATPQVGVTGFCSIVRVCVMLSRMSGSNVERTDYLLTAQHHALRMLCDPLAEVMRTMPVSSVVATPESLEEWANFKFTDQLLAQLQECKGTFEISLASVGRPERLLHYIDYLCSGLESVSMHLQCLPVCQLGVLIAKIVANDDSLAGVYHLRLASLADALFLKSAAIMHEELAGALELSIDEIRRGREEVQRQETLKASFSGDGPSSGVINSSKSLRPYALRDYWIARGAYLEQRGALVAANVLLQETIRHARAHDDVAVEARAYLHLAKCAARGNMPIDAVKLQHRGQTLGGDVSFWGESMCDYTMYKLSTRDGKLSAKESLVTALNLLQSRSNSSRRGNTLDTKMVMANLLTELSRLLELEMKNAVEVGENPQAQYADAVNAISEAVAILQDCGGGMDYVNVLMAKAMLMYKDPTASGDPRPGLRVIKEIIFEAEMEAERIYTAACVSSISPLTTSLPAARLLAAVKNARAGCLLEIAHAEKVLESVDRENSRPDFPSIQGVDATAILAFLDDSAPKSFKDRLDDAEEAIVVASEATNLHKRNDGRIDSLCLLGEALLAVHNAQTRTKIWRKPAPVPPPTPPPPPAPPSPNENEEEEAAEGDEPKENAETPEAADAEDVNPEPTDDDAAEEVPQSEASDAATDIPLVEEEDEEDETQVPHSTFRDDLVKPRAVHSLEQAIQLGIEAGKYDLVSKAAMYLAHAHGTADTAKAAAALALAQSCHAVETHLSIFLSAADEQDIESLIIRNDRNMHGSLNDMTSSKYSASLVERLKTSCKAWGNLQIDKKQALSASLTLPDDLFVFSVQWLVGRGGDTSLAITMHGKDDERTGAYVVSANQEQLEAAVELTMTYRSNVEKAVVAANSSEDPDALQSVFESIDIVAGWDEVRKATEWVLEPIISAWRSFLGKGGSKEKKIVLLVDEALASLPIEALEFLNDAESISRDFSLHMLVRRLAQASDIPAAQMTALVDLRKEDLPQADDETKIPGQFALLQQKFGSGWNVLMGTPESIPGDAECQRAMIAAKALLYYGHGRFLSYVSSSAVASVDMSGCRLAVLACNTNNEESQRMQAMLDGRKTTEKKALEDPYRTAALLSMRGVESIVLPTFTVGSARANSEFLTSVLSGGTIASSVWKADAPKPPRKEEDSDENEPEEKEVEEPEEGEKPEGEEDAGDEAEAVEPPPPPPPPPPSGPYRTYVVYGHPLVKIS